MPLHAATIFVASFLLFLIQPILGKAVLPWFGGAPAVWSTCMLFFQAGLLAGYGWSGVVLRLGPKRGAAAHLMVLVAGLLLMPVVPDAHWKPVDDERPALRILVLLTATAGLPYFALAATSPLLQAWSVAARGAKSPYWMYGWSNIGAMLALAAYPFVVEPSLDVDAQARLFTVLYSACCVLSAAAAGRRALRSPASTAANPEPETEAPPPSRRRRLQWLALSATGTAMLLATTNQMCQEVAVVPFLWIVPLAIYLLTMASSFARRGALPTKWAAPTLAVSVGASYAATALGAHLPMRVSVALLSAGLFGCCMVCHSQLARLKPHPARLVSYYRIVALGGALGGAFVSLAAPALFSFYFELQLALAASVAVGMWAAVTGDDAPPDEASRRRKLMMSQAVAGLLLVFFAEQVRRSHADFRVVVRNFYGVLRVSDVAAHDAAPPTRMLVHGATRHGLQIRSPERKNEPTGYYGRDGGAGVALRAHHADRPRRVGVIGLGAGTLAAYGKAGDVFRFYEINPAVVDLARREFSFLAESKAAVEIVTGDARLQLEREGPQGFDVLVVDAFSGDAIPVHLCTLEGIDLYRRRLAPDGVLAFNVSNRSLDFEPVLRAVADATSLRAALVVNDADESAAVDASDWILLSSTPAFFDHPLVRERSEALTAPALRRPWTDRFSGLSAILK
jgi:hypothetical protein